MGRIFAILIILFAFPHYLLAADYLIMGKPDDPVADLSALILKEAYQRIGYDLHTYVQPAERSLLESNAGKLDGEVARIKGLERTYPNLIRVPAAVTFIEGVVFTTRTDIQISNWETLRPYTIAIRIGTKFAEKSTQGMTVTKLPSNKNLLMFVALKRSDLGIASRIETIDMRNQLNLTQIRILDPPLIRLHLYHYLNKKHRHIIPRITRVLTEMEKQGVLYSLRQEYIENLGHPNSRSASHY